MGASRCLLRGCDRFAPLLLAGFVVALERTPTMITPTRTCCVAFTALLSSVFLVVPALRGFAQTTNEVLSLDGSTGYVSISSADELQSDEISIEAWIYPTQVPNDQLGSFINKSDGLSATSQRTYEWRWLPGNTLTFSFFLVHVDGLSDAVGLAVPVMSNEWTHVAASFSASASSLQIYTNGILATWDNGSNAAPIQGRSLRQTAMPLVFGWTPSFANDYASGYMDEVRIWKVARSAQDISANMFCRLTGTEPNLAGYWNFDNGTANDLTGHGHNGTFEGTAQAVPIVGSDAIHAGGCGVQTYFVRDLGTLGGNSSLLSAINSSGAAAGNASNAQGNYHAVVLSNGALLDLGTLGGLNSLATDINQSGQVVGFANAAGSTAQRAFIYQQTIMTDLSGSIAGSVSAIANGINSSGAVVGGYHTANDQRPFLYTNGIAVDLGFSGWANCINDVGQIGGFENSAGHLGFIISTGQKHYVGNDTEVGKINNSGTAVGNSLTAQSTYHAFMYQGGTIMDLGTLGGDSSAAYGINNLGQTVGQAKDTQGVFRAYVYQSGKMLDLNTLLPTGSGWFLTIAYAINDAGQIVGGGQVKGQTHGFLLTPATLPALPPHAATASAVLTNGSVVGATITDGGSGYTNTPTIRIIGVGIGAQAVAVVINGVVIAVNILNAGSGYTSPPVVVIAPPFIEQPTMGIVPLPVIGGSTTQLFQLGFGRLSPYDNYQLEFTPVVGGAWSNFAWPFIPTSTVSTQDVITSGQSGFFRVRHEP